MFQRISIIIALLLLIGCNQQQHSQTAAADHNTNKPPAADNTGKEKNMAAPKLEAGKNVTFPSGLQIEVKQMGTGNIPKKGEKIRAHYHGTFTNGNKFDSSIERGTPYEFTVGQGQVIQGWDEAFQLLPVGSKARLTIPPDLGYGAQDHGTIPPNSTLIFDVELLAIIQ
jgi:peptidylprolyl isomerase